MLPLLRTILLLLWFRNFSEVYDFNLMTLEKHKEKIEHPELIYPEWGTYNEIQQEGFKKHWKKEITNFEIQIERRKREIERRRSADG